MSVPQSASDFFELLQRSSLIEHVQLDTLCALHPELFADGVAALDCARGLVEQRMVTAYQARLLLTGRHKGFYVGKYKVLELLGRGGMGHVFLAEQVAMQRLVAIKVVNRPVSPESETYTRFIREARAIAALRHPNIIQAFDFDETSDGVPYIVMEYIEGLDVARQVQRFGPISPEQTADYITQAAEGLQHAHERGFVHRDIKPGNLLVDAAGVLRLLDLGLVSEAEQISTDGHLTSEDGYLGTLDYIAPEQALDSHTADTRSDIYSLGAVSYFALSGQQMYPKSSAAQKLLFHQTTEPTPLPEINPALPEKLCDVIHRMLAKNPDDRFQSPAEVRAAVEPFAKRTIPPFDIRAIGYSRDRMDRFLRHSPSSTGLSSSGLSSSSISPTGLPLVAPDGLSSVASSGSGRPLPEATLSDSSPSGLVFVDAPLPSELPRLSDRDSDGPLSADGDSHLVYQTGSVIDAGYSETHGVRDIPTFESLQAGDPEQQATIQLRRWSHVAVAVLLLACLGGAAWYWSNGRPDQPTGPSDTIIVDNAPSGSAGMNSGTANPGSETSQQPDEDPGTHTTDNGSDDATSNPPGDQVAAVDTGTGGDTTAAPGTQDAYGNGQPEDAVEVRSRPPLPIRKTALDRLSRDDIDLYELATAERTAGGSIDGLAGIFGDSRMSHWNAVTAVAWSPDGSRIASASNDRTIRYWNPETGHELRLLHSGDPRTTAMSFSRDGRKLAVGDADGFVSVYDVVSSQRIWHEPLERGFPLVMEFSADHRDLYVVCRAIWGLQVFDATTGQHRSTVPLGESPASMAISADGTRAAVGLSDGAVLVRDLVEDTLLHRLEEHVLSVTNLQFGPDDTHLLSTSRSEYQSVLWDLSDGTVSQKIIFTEPPHCSTFTSDGRHTLTAEGWPMRFDDLDVPEEPAIRYGPAGTTRTFSVSPDRSWVVAGSDDHHLRIWNSRDLNQKFEGAPVGWGVLGFSLSGDGSVLATGDNREARVWDVATRQLQNTIANQNGPMLAFALSPDGRTLAGGGGHGRNLMFWNAETIDRQHQIPVKLRPHAVAFSADSTRLAVTLLNDGHFNVNSVWIYNPVTGEPMTELQDPTADNSGRCLVFSPDGSSVVAAGTTGIVVWDAQTGEMKNRLTPPDIPPVEGERRKTGDNAYFASIALTPDGSQLFGARQDGRVHVWDVQSGDHQQVVWSATSPVESVAVSPDGETVAWSAREGCIWKLPLSNLSAEPQRLQIGPAHGIVHQVAFGPESRHLLAANGNGTVYVLRMDAPETD